MRRALKFLAVLALLLASAVRTQAATFERSAVEVAGAGGSHFFQVEVATTLEQRAQGLMGRNSLAPDAGMLFLFPEERQVSMWMRDTRIPLDMLFLASDGRIVKIASAKPLSDDVIPSGGAVRGVLELAGGTAARLGLKPGDRLVHPAFRGKQ